MLSSLTIGLTPACADPAAITGSHDISAVNLRPAVFIPQVASAKRADDLVNSIGVNVHLSYFRTPYGTGWNDIIKPKILELGVRHLRDGGVVVPDNKWMETVYGRMKEVAKEGVKFDLIMRPPLDSDDYTRMDHFDRLMQYAGPAVESVEGLNEHDLSKRSSWTTEVRSFQKALYQKVKSDPRYEALPVYGPSIGHPANAPAVGDLSAYMDMGSLHPYPGGSPPLTNMIQHEGLLRSVFGAKRFVVTESGYHTALGWTGGHPGVAEEAMARYIMRLVLEYFDLGIPRTYLYELIDQGDDQRDREQNFGLLRMNGSEKPAFTALKHLIGLLADPGPEFETGRLAYAARGATAGVRQVLLQKRDGRYYLILWQNKMSFDLGTKSLIFPKTLDVTLELDRQATSVKVYMPLESRSPIEQLDRVRTIPVSVPDSPIVVEIKP